jgi:hypothetical protein
MAKRVSSAEECSGALLKKYQQLQLIFCGCVNYTCYNPPHKKEKKKKKGKNDTT